MYVRPEGVSTFESLTGETVTLDGGMMTVLQTLDETKRESPADPTMTRTALKQATSLDAIALDRTVQFFLETGEIETVSTQNTSFLTAKITERGRERLEERDEDSS
ncbi:hypothetical protein ACLI4Z_16615 (plasmid) [Natrialbaceae archaeon A-arb3/5]